MVKRFFVVAAVIGLAACASAAAPSSAQSAFVVDPLCAQFCPNDYPFISTQTAADACVARIAVQKCAASLKALRACISAKACDANGRTDTLKETDSNANGGCAEEVSAEFVACDRHSVSDAP